MSTNASVPVQDDSEAGKQRMIMSAFPTLLEKTEKQAAILLGIVNRLEDLMGENRSATEGTDIPSDVRKKAADTALTALRQLDNMMDDMQRWNAEGCQLEKVYTKYLSTATDLADSHLIRTRQDTMPHVRYDARVYRVGENDWIACFVQGKNEYALGRGRTAYDALSDFDQHFIKGFETKGLPSRRLEEPSRAKKKPSARRTLKK